MTKSLSQLFSWLVVVLVFFIPSNLFLVLNESVGYVNGLRIDYLLPKLFLTDLIIILLIISGIFLDKRRVLVLLKKFLSSKNSQLLLFFITLFIIAQYFSAFPLVSYYSLVKVLEFSLLTIVLFIHRKKLDLKLIYGSIVLALATQTIFASYQHLYQHSFTPYWLLGESMLNESMVGLARGSFGGAEHLLAYGTTPHPNVLAGIFVLLSLIVLNEFKHNKNVFCLLITANILIIFLTQSWSALLALSLGLTALFVKNIFKVKVIYWILFFVAVTPLLLLPLSTYWDHTSIMRREVLNTAAFQMFLLHPISGIGLGNFTAVLESFVHNREFVRFIQPAHNAVWLLLAETGVIGILVATQVIKKVEDKYILSAVGIALIPVLALDHYLVTTQSGILALIFFLLFFLHGKSVKE